MDFSLVGRTSFTAGQNFDGLLHWWQDLLLSSSNFGGLWLDLFHVALMAWWQFFSISHDGSLVLSSCLVPSCLGFLLDA